MGGHHNTIPKSDHFQPIIDGAIGGAHLTVSIDSNGSNITLAHPSSPSTYRVSKIMVDSDQPLLYGESGASLTYTSSGTTVALGGYIGNTAQYIEWDKDAIKLQAVSTSATVNLNVCYASNI